MASVEQKYAGNKAHLAKIVGEISGLKARADEILTTQLAVESAQACFLLKYLKQCNNKNQQSNKANAFVKTI